MKETQDDGQSSQHHVDNAPGKCVRPAANLDTRRSYQSDHYVAKEDPTQHGQIPVADLHAVNVEEHRSEPTTALMQRQE